MEREGLSREAAEREARRRFGDYDAYRKRSAHDRRQNAAAENRTWTMLESVKRETRHAARRSLARPAFSFIAIVTLALGLGAATTIFTLLDRVVLRPLPYSECRSARPHRHAVAEGQGRRRVRHRARPVLLLQETQHASLHDIAFYDVDHVGPDGDGDHPRRACLRDRRQREHVRDVRHPIRSSDGCLPSTTSSIPTAIRA